MIGAPESLGSGLLLTWGRSGVVVPVSLNRDKTRAIYRFFQFLFNIIVPNFLGDFSKSIYFDASAPSIQASVTLVRCLELTPVFFGLPRLLLLRSIQPAESAKEDWWPMALRVGLLPHDSGIIASFYDVLVWARLGDKSRGFEPLDDLRLVFSLSSSLAPPVVIEAF